MKTISKKLALKKITLRTLTSELASVSGGGDAVEGLKTVIKDLVPFTSNCPVSGFCRDAP